MWLCLAVLLIFSACASEAPDGDGEHSAADADWCVEHGLPESKCTKCSPDLVAEFQAAGDWCAEHGFPESLCPICNPDLVAEFQAAGDWCVEHGLPESSCPVCSPDLVAEFQAAGDWCAEHGFPESLCPICNPQAPPGEAVVELTSPTIVAGTRIRFRSPAIERAAGIGIVRARGTALAIGVECTARIVFDRNRLADIRSSVPGVVRDVRVDLGERVGEGTELFVLESAQVGDMQGDLRAARERAEVARANYERQLELREPRIASARQVELAREQLETAAAELRSIEVGLRIAGATESDREGRFRVRSPIAGTVVRRPATIGTFATNEVSLATVVDTSRMWAMLEVREMDAGALRIGQAVTLKIDGLPEDEFTGPVTWIASEVDVRTRTVAARAEMANDLGLLRAEQFARATIRVAEPENAVVVPRRAVQRVGEESVVFVRIGEGLYEPRIVSLGRSDAELVQVLGARREGDAVVTEGAFLLKTELSRDSIGAGCCEVEPPGGS